MKCPHCNYVSHDYLDVCRSCGGDWSAVKARTGLRVRPPGIVPDLSEVAAKRARRAVPDVAAAAPGTDTRAPDAVPTLEFVEIEDEPSGGTGPDPR